MILERVCKCHEKIFVKNERALDLRFLEFETLKFKRRLISEFIEKSIVV